MVDNLLFIHHEHMGRFQARTNLGIHHPRTNATAFGDLFGSLFDLLLRGPPLQCDQTSTALKQRQRPPRKFGHRSHGTARHHGKRMFRLNRLAIQIQYRTANGRSPAVLAAFAIPGASIATIAALSA